MNRTATQDASATAPQTQRRGLGLRAKIVIAFALVSLFVSGLTAVGMYITQSRRVVEGFRQRLVDIVSIAALLQDGDEHAQLTLPVDTASHAFLKLNKVNDDILTTDPDVLSMYTMRRGEKGSVFFVLDAERPGNGKTPEDFVNVPYDDMSDTLAANFDTLSQAIVEPSFYSDEFSDAYGISGYLSAYAPVLRSDGTREAVLGVDISAETVYAAQRQLGLQALVVFLVMVAIGTLVGFLVGTALTRPMIRISQGAGNFAAGDFGSRIDISTGDEIEQVAITLNAMAGEISGLVTNLEDRVAERTEQLGARTLELENLTEETQDRARKLRAVAEVARSITSLRDMVALLDSITETVSREFGYYHVGIFLNDEPNEFAVLQAANSEGGKRMLERGHRLRIGQTGIVGYAAGAGLPRIALDTGADAVFFDNPELPGTRSEVALPLRDGTKVIGVLDVQSIEPGAFSEIDVELLSILADQVSTAIQNAHLFDETNQALREVQSVYRQYLRQEWSNFLSETTDAGFSYEAGQLRPLDKLVSNAEIRQVYETGEPLEKSKSIAVPIKLRNEILGVVHLHPRGNHAITEDEMDVILAVAERTGMAVENARLLHDSQQRAAKERTIGEISAKISATTDLENVIQTAVEELGRNLPGAEIVIQFQGEPE